MELQRAVRRLGGIYELSDVGWAKLFTLASLLAQIGSETRRARIAKLMAGLDGSLRVSPDEFATILLACCKDE